MYSTYQKYLGCVSQENLNQVASQNAVDLLPKNVGVQDLTFPGNDQGRNFRTTKANQYQKVETPAENFENSSVKPSVWGPVFWSGLHLSAVFYPEKASPIVKERMKHRILAIPYEIPCDLCRNHALSFIESHQHRLDEIVDGRKNLNQFYVDFHNKVNERHGKPQWTAEQALKFYRGQFS